MSAPSGRTSDVEPQNQTPATGPGAEHGTESQAGPGGHPGRPVEARTRQVAEWLAIVVVALVAAFLIRSFAIEQFFIPSASMEPTLQPGDRVFVNKLSYDLHSVHDGDVIVFRRPPRDHSNLKDLIKRVIAGPGQLLYVSHCHVYVNGKEQPQTYLPKGWQSPASAYCTFWDAPGMLQLPDPYRVPARSYFVMGDNRTDSDDSRFWGPVPASYIVGRAFVRVWPPSRLGLL